MRYPTKTGNKDLTIYKVEQKLLSLCLSVEHRDFKVNWTKLLDEWVWLGYLQRFWPTKTGPTTELVATDIWQQNRELGSNVQQRNQTVTKDGDRRLDG